MSLMSAEALGAMIRSTQKAKTDEIENKLSKELSKIKSFAPTYNITVYLKTREEHEMAKEMLLKAGYNVEQSSFHPAINQLDVSYSAFGFTLPPQGL